MNAIPAQTLRRSHSFLEIVCLAVMALMVVAKALWLASGISYVGLTQPMMLFAAAAVLFAASTVLLVTRNPTAGVALAWVAVILAFVAGQTGGVTPGPGHSRFEEQYRNHICDFIFLLAANLQFWLLLRRNRTTILSIDGR